MKLWIRLDVAIRSDPNVAELADRLGMRFAEAVGCCTLLWCAIGEHRPNGDISGIGIPAIEKWASFEPRKGSPAGSFGRAFLDLFACDGMASGWRDRQGALIERAEAERQRWHRRNSAEAPPDSSGTERNGTEQDQNPTTARVRLRLEEADRPSLDTFLSRVPEPTTWAAELEAILDGMHGPKVSPETMGRAIRDLIANGKLKFPNIRQFRRYIEGARNDKPLTLPTNVRARAERLYTELPRHGFTQNLPFDQHYARAEELSKTGTITDLAQFRRELDALLPLTWLRDAREFDREKSIARIAAAIAPVQQAAA